jgi:hypothetical protein
MDWSYSSKVSYGGLVMEHIYGFGGILGSHGTGIIIQDLYKVDVV